MMAVEGASGLIPLRSLVEGRQPNRENAVAFTAEGAVDWLTLESLVRSGLQSIEWPQSRFVLVRAEAGHELLACMLAAWRTDRVPVLASDNVANSVSEGGAVAVPGAGRCLLQGVARSAILEGDIDGDAALVLFTSGSSGAPTAAVKSFCQLDSELALLEACWGDRVDGSVFATTVSRRHMYGLPFSLLWPLVRGNAFYSEKIHYSQSLETLCRRFSLTLVSSPVQLDNLPDSLDWPVLKAGTAAIFSAGAPLPAAIACKCRKKLTPVIEIYGSTETGAVAWRDQTVDPDWQCLPNISVADEEGQLRITSPCLGKTATMTVADRADVFTPQRFHLLGRVDRIVKVAGKRISLNEVESRLLSHPWVDGARALQLIERKSRVGAVVVLSPLGRAALIDQGRNSINRMLSNHVGPCLEPVAVPRYWRYVGRLPQNSQGKVTGELVESLFVSSRQPRLPELLEQQGPEATGVCTLIMRIPDNLFYFSGHFPGNPVLPGVVQLSWADHYGTTFFGGLGVFRRVERLKFQKIIQPGDVVTLVLEWQAEKSQLQFSFSSAAARHSSGRLVYGGTYE